MKVAVSSTGNTIDSELDSRFGRCAWFIIVNTDDMSHEAIANSNNDMPSGAGIQSASLVVSRGVEAVLTGNCGPKAAQAFYDAGVQVYTGYSGTVRQAVESFKENGGSDSPAGQNGEQPVPGSAGQMPGGGMGGGGRGMGGGGGRGMGGGGGRGRSGCGRGMRMGGQGFGIPSASPGSASSEDLASLKQQAGELKRALEDIEKKIGDLE
ncbi:MAG: NifB/NifX family molybdenum-iron cluster-binding protein [Desulfosudaceae bacterium]